MENFDLAGLLGGMAEGGIRLVVGLLILLAFWVVAVLVRRIIRTLLGKTNIDNKLAQTMGGEGLPVEKTIASIVFFIIMFFGVIAAFNHWQLDAVTGPLNTMLDTIMGFIPTLGGALVLGVIAWVVATVVKMIIERGADMLDVDSRIRQLDSEADVSASESS